MATYQLPPPPVVDDYKQQEWMFELYKRNQSLIDSASQGSMIGDVTAPVSPFDGGNLVLTTSINLPNVTAIDGGAADTDYTAQSQGPFGVLSNQLEVQEDGFTLTTGVSQFNFKGFVLTEPVADEIAVQLGPSAASTIYDPGYSSYTRVSDSTFTIDLVDAVNLFYVGRRVRFAKAGTFTYGAVSARDFDSTAANDTFLTMTMESSDTIPTGVFTVALVSSATAWSPISGDPFSGGRINDIITGPIAGVQWWFAVGNDGKVATSNDGGATWTLRSTSNTEHMNVCTYDSDNEIFWGGGNTGVVYKCTNGIAITEDTTSVPLLATTGNSNITGMGYSTGESGVGIMFKRTTSERFGRTQDQGTTWISGGSLANLNLNKSLNCIHSGAFPTTGNAWFAIIFNNTSDFQLTSIADAGWSSATAIGEAPTCAHSFYDGGIPGAVKIFGHSGGNIRGRINWIGIDDATFTQTIRDFAWSPLHARLVCVGANQTIGYLDTANQDVDDAWTSVANGFDPTAEILAVDWNPTDGLYIAVAANGQIARSTNGTN